MLAEIVLKQGSDTDDIISALLGLAYLEFGPSSAKVTRGRFASVIWGLDVDNSDDGAIGAALRLIGRYQCNEALEWACTALRSKNVYNSLMAAGTLSQLGVSGHGALMKAAAETSNGSAVAKAVIKALNSNEFDGLDPFLAAPNWLERNAAFKLVGDLVVAGASAEAALEILLQRFKEDDDVDNKASISISLGCTLAQLGSVALKAVATLDKELSPRDEGLIDAILFSGLPVTHEDLLLLGSRRRDALKRLLSVHSGLPPSISDWVGGDRILTALQWTAWTPPSIVAGWFGPDTSVDGVDLTSSILEHAFCNHDGSLACAYFASHFDEIAAIWERLRILRMHQGDESCWELFSAVMAGSWQPVTACVAELRCAFGSMAGPPLGATPGSIGRLLAVAGSPLRHAVEAMRLLSCMGDDVRVIAANLLATTPSGLRNLKRDECAPADSGYGVHGVQNSGLGSGPITLISPQSVADHFKPFFGLCPALRSPMVVSDALRAASRWNCDHWRGLADWQNPDSLRRLLDALPPDVVRGTALALQFGRNRSMRELAQTMVAAAGLGDVLISEAKRFMPMAEETDDDRDLDIDCDLEDLLSQL